MRKLRLFETVLKGQFLEANKTIFYKMLPMAEGKCSTSGSLRSLSI